MSNYSENPESVRVDFFKPSGKWCKTEAINWVGWSGDIHDEFKESLKASGNVTGNLIAICLHPHNKNEHPLMLVASQ